MFNPNPLMLGHNGIVGRDKSSPMVVSVEHVTRNFLSGQSPDIALTKGQNPAQCVPFLSWRRSTQNLTLRASCVHQPTPEIWDNAGTATLRLHHLGNKTYLGEQVHCEVSVVEFSEDIRVHSGQHTQTGTAQLTHYAFDTVVNTSAAFPIFYGRIDNAGGSAYRYTDEGAYISSTHFTCEFALDVTTDRWGTWFVVEDLTGKHFTSTARFLGTSWNVNGDFDLTIPAVDLDKTFLITNTNRDGNSSFAVSEGISVYFQDSTTIRCSRTGIDSVSGQIRNRISVVEFLNGTNVKHTGYHSMESGTVTKDVTIGSVDPDKSTVIQTPHDKLPFAIESENGDDEAMKAVTTGVLTSGTNLRLQRYTNLNRRTRHAASVIEWDM